MKNKPWHREGEGREEMKGGKGNKGWKMGTVLKQQILLLFSVIYADTGSSV